MSYYDNPCRRLMNLGMAGWRRRYDEGGTVETEGEGDDNAVMSKPVTRLTYEQFRQGYRPTAYELGYTTDPDASQSSYGQGTPFSRVDAMRLVSRMSKIHFLPLYKRLSLLKSVKASNLGTVGLMQLERMSLQRSPKRERKECR